MNGHEHQNPVNEGREARADGVKDALRDLIKDDLDQIRDACKNIERKVGKDDSWDRTDAITHALFEVLTSQHHVACAIIGWCDIYENRDPLVHTCSWASAPFYKDDYDQGLAQLLTNLLRMAETEKYELIDKVQKERT